MKNVTLSLLAAAAIGAISIGSVSAMPVNNLAGLGESHFQDVAAPLMSRVCLDFVGPTSAPKLVHSLPSKGLDRGVKKEGYDDLL